MSVNKNLEKKPHCHEHAHHNQQHVHGVVKNMFWAFIINACFTIIEFIGGIIFNSAAILSDAVHDLGDTFALGSSIILERRSLKKRDSMYSFGYRRLSILSGLLSCIILISGSIVMFIKSIDRFINPLEVNSEGMIGMGILGIVFNGLAVLKMKGSSGGVNARALYLHLLEDAIGWIVILIGAICIHLFDIPILDPILSITLSIFIIFNAIKLLKPVYKILMVSTPEGLDISEVKSKIESMEGVIEMHDIHTWSLDGDFNILTAHLIVKNNTDHSLKIAVTKLLKEQNIHHTTLEIEKEGEPCDSKCN